LPPPPSILLLQFFNFAAGLGSFLAALSAIAAWNRDGWSQSSIGLATTIGMLCYGGVVFIGGRLSDGWGRARTAAVGAAIAALGSAVAAAHANGVTALIASMAGFAGAALFFPGNVGLFSDAQAPVGARTLPLHVKVSRYNLGWSLGNLSGFMGYALLDKQPTWVGFAICAAVFSIPALWMCRWLRLPASPPVAEGDRSPHPALKRLTMIGRTALLIACMLTMAQITMLQSALQGEGLAKDVAQAWAGRTWMVYSTCYVLSFLLFGSWSGWILRPWRLAAMQGAFLIGSAGYIAIGLSGSPSPIALAVCGGFLGIGFGASYVSSIYYSLRLPHGAGRAAALHETFLGIGNTAGPLLAGWVLTAWVQAGAGSSLLGIGAWTAFLGVVLMIWQIAMVPGAVRQGAKGHMVTPLANAESSSVTAK
jgi:MFS family permease